MSYYCFYVAELIVQLVLAMGHAEAVVALH